MDKTDLDLFGISLAIAVYETNLEYRMSTIGEQLKSARAQIASARGEAAKAVSESNDAAQLVIQEAAKARKEAADLRAEVAELTNGGPALDDATPLPVVTMANLTPQQIRESSAGPAPTFP